MTEAVLDASAVLALLRSESGAEIVERALAQDVWAISAVNVAEVATKLFDEGMPSQATESMLDSLGVDIRPFDHEVPLPRWPFGLRPALAACRSVTVPASPSSSCSICP